METSRLKLGELREHPIIRAILSQAKYTNANSQFNESNFMYESGAGKFVFKSKECKCCGSTYSPRSRTQTTCSLQCRIDMDVLNKFKRYGMTVFDYIDLWESNDGKCHICDSEGFLMKNQGYKDKGRAKDAYEQPNVLPLVVDHCHTTGTVRGLLCHNCNRALGLFSDKINNLNKAIGYLEGATTIPKGSTHKRVEAPSPIDMGEDIV